LTELIRVEWIGKKDWEKQKLIKSNLAIWHGEKLFVHLIDCKNSKAAAKQLCAVL
jgi:hypothetical protein